MQLNKTALPAAGYAQQQFEVIRVPKFGPSSSDWDSYGSLGNADSSSLTVPVSKNLTGSATAETTENWVKGKKIISWLVDI